MQEVYENKLQETEELQKMNQREDVPDFWAEEDGVGVIELVLILVVLISLVLIFKTQLTTLLKNIFSKITSKTNEVY